MQNPQANIITEAQMQVGPYAGQSLSPFKRSAKKLASQTEGSFLISNVRFDNRWWFMEIDTQNIASYQLLGQTEMGEEQNVHVMLRCQLQTPATLYPMDGVQSDRAEMQDFILSVNPHEANGQTVAGRRDGVHTTAFRVLPTNKLFKALKKSPTTIVESNELNLSANQKNRVLDSFLSHSAERAGTSLFNYTQNNCSTHLWDSLFDAFEVESFVSEKHQEQLKTLAKRGRNSFTIAQEMGILGKSCMDFRQAQATA
ncbi:MAG: hypothetical protein AAF203_03110 [Pseudomonadota bacterium]